MPNSLIKTNKMKKIIMLATTVAILVGCKKSADGVITVVSPKNATLTGVLVDSFLSPGPNTIGAASFVVPDTVRVQVVRVYIKNTSVNLQNVRVVFSSPNTGDIEAKYLDFIGDKPEGREYSYAPFGKNLAPDTYSVKAYADISINGVKDSLVASISLDCRTGLTNYNLKVKSNQIFFITGNVTTKISTQTPITKRIVHTTTGALMTTLNTTVVGKDQTLTGVKVSINNPLVNNVLAFIGGNSIGSTVVNGAGVYTVTCNRVLAKGSSTDITIVYALGSFTSTTQTGLAATATVTGITYADQSQNDNNTYQGNPMYVYKHLLAASGGGISSQITSGKVSLYKINFSGMGAVKQLSYNLNWTIGGSDTLKIPLSFEDNGTDVSGNVWITNQNGDTLNATTITPASTKIFVTFNRNGVYESVINGSKTLDLQGTFVGFTSANSSVKITPESDVQYSTPGNLSWRDAKKFQVSIGGAISGMVISDMSSTGHNGVVNQSNNDWFSGYGISPMPYNLFYK